MSKQYFKNKKLFFRFFFSFMIIGVIPILIFGFLSYGRILSVMKENVISSNIAMINQGKENMDQYISRMYNLQGQLSQNNRITGFFTNEITDRADKLFSIKTIREELNKYDLADDALTDTLTVYFLKNRVTITPTTFYEGDEFFRDVRRFADMNATAVYNRLQHASPRQYWESRIVYDEYNKTREVITCIQALPVYAQNSYGYLIIMINEDTIWEMFGKNNPDQQDGFLGIADAQGKILALSQNEKTPEISRHIEGLSPVQASGYLEIEEDQAKYIVTYTTSDINQWRYFNVIPEKNILDKIAPVKLLFVNAITLAMLLAFFTSWVLSQRNSKPIREIVQLIESNIEKASRDKINDYKMIRNTVSNMFEVTKEMQSKIALHMEFARMHFLLTLFRDMADERKIKESVALYNIHLPHRYFVVAVLEIVEHDKQSLEKEQNYKNFIRFAASNMIEKAFASDFQAYSVELSENRIGLLLNTDLQQNEENRPKMESLFREIIEIFESKLKVHTSIGIGNQYASLEKTGQSCNEAVSALEYISIRSSYQIMYYDQLQTFANSLYYPLEKEQQLFNYIKLSDIVSAEALLDDIYHINFVERKIPLKQAWYLMNNLMSSLLKILEELKLDSHPYFDENGGFMADMNGSGNIAEVFQSIKENLRRLCTQIAEKKNNHNLQLRDNVIRYVESSYADCNLSLVQAADHFKVTAPYLSRFFKEQTGYNFNDYVNRYRIRQAKALIEQTGLSVSEISEKVGYNSSGTFIRIFKRYESITPGQYKESLPKTED